MTETANSSIHIQEIEIMFRPSTEEWVAVKDGKIIGGIAKGYLLDGAFIGN